MNSTKISYSNLYSNSYIVEKWNGGYKLEVDLTSKSQISDWTLDFNLSNSYKIRGAYGVDLVEQGGNNYSISGQGGWQDLEAGETAKAIFIIDGDADKASIPKFIASGSSITTEPVTTEPVITEPVITEPVITEPVITEPETIEQQINASSRVVEDWNGGYKLEVDLTSESKASDWTLDFDLPYSIRGAYGVDLVDNGGNSYSISGQGDWQDLEAGETAKAIFIIDDNGRNAIAPTFNNLMGSIISDPEPAPQPTQDVGMDIEGDGDGDGSYSRSGNGSHLQVEGKFLYDANGDRVIMRGIESVVRYGQYQGSGEWNDPYEDGWLVDGNGDNVEEIAKTGANATRLIGGRPDEFERSLEEAVDNNLWVSIAHVDFRDQQVMETIKEYEGYVTLHAQGEVVHQDEHKWREDSIKAIQEIRELGYKAPIEITAGYYGQRFEMILNQGEAVFNSDPMKNVVFVTQAYSEIEHRGGVTTNLDKFEDFSAPILVGSSYFGQGVENGYGNNSDTYKEVWDETYERDLGSFYWVWSDAGYGDVVSSSGSSNELTSVGEYLVNDSPASLSSHAPKTEFLWGATL